MRRMLRVATGGAVVMPVVTLGSARALDGHGRLAVLGASPWEVKERCGEPTAIDDVMKHLPQRAYDPISQTPGYILVPVQQSIWTDNVGPTRFVYDLTFQDGKLIDITTGDYGHYTAQPKRWEFLWRLSRITRRITAVLLPRGRTCHD